MIPVLPLGVCDSLSLSPSLSESPPFPFPSPYKGRNLWYPLVHLWEDKFILVIRMVACGIQWLKRVPIFLFGDGLSARLREATMSVEQCAADCQRFASTAALFTYSI